MFDLYHKTNKHENPNQNQGRPRKIIKRGSISSLACKQRPTK
jgi:hypothetical protein